MNIKRLVEMQDIYSPDILGPGGIPVKWPYTPMKTPETVPIQTQNTQIFNSFLQEFGLTESDLQSPGRELIYDDDGKLVGIKFGNNAIIHFEEARHMDGFELLDLYVRLRLMNPPMPMPINLVIGSGVFLDLDGDGIFESFLSEEASDYYYDIFRRYNLAGQTPNSPPPKNIGTWSLKNLWWMYDETAQRVLDAADWFEQAWDDLFG